MEIKTKKQKCLDMWEWLADNPGSLKSAYFAYLCNQNRSDEYSNCWACIAACHNCDNCPVQWAVTELTTSYDTCPCQVPTSPYHIWGYNVLKHDLNIKIVKQAAEQIIHLIKTTWKE